MNIERDRNSRGRAQQARPRDELGRPLDYGVSGVPPLEEPLPHTPEAAINLAQELLDAGRPFQAHEVLEEMWRSCPADQREGWQGLAQVAVAITHDGRGNRHGTDQLLRRASSRLQSGADALPSPIDSTAIMEWLDRARHNAAEGRSLPQGLRLTGPISRKKPTQ